MKKVIKHLFFFPLHLVFVLFSCSSDRVFETYHGMESLTWPVEDTVTFEVGGIQQQKDLIPILGIRFNDDFDYHNLYVRCYFKDSAGNLIQEKLVNVQLFDAKTGRPLGSGFGNVFSKYDTLPMEFSETGKPSKIQFVQYMRSDKLKGIESIGLKIIKKR